MPFVSRVLLWRQHLHRPLRSHCHKSTFVRPVTDLASFLRESHGKDQTTSTFRGTVFEWETCEALQAGMGMQLRRVGGRGDRGVDLYGEWPIAALVNQSDKSSPRIIVQCKKHKSGCTPDHVRALVGAVVLASDSAKDTIGILAGVRPFTREVMDHFLGSNVPLGLARIRDTTVQSLLFNAAAEDALQGLMVITQYNVDGTADSPVLMYDGRPVELDPSSCYL